MNEEVDVTDLLEYIDEHRQFEFLEKLSMKFFAIDFIIRDGSVLVRVQGRSTNNGSV